MRHQLTGLIGVWRLASTTLAATAFWEEKDFRTWSNQEVQEILTNSPWAKPVRLLVGGRRDAAEPTQVTFTWTSALPIKQALVRQSIGLNGSLPADSQSSLDRSESFYVLTRSGLPPTLRWLATQRVQLETLFASEIRGLDRDKYYQSSFVAWYVCDQLLDQRPLLRCWSVRAAILQFCCPGENRGLYRAGAL